MFNLDSSITSISEEQLDQLFESTSDGAPNADDLLGGKQKSDETKTDDKKADATKQVQVPKSDIDTIDDIDALLADEPVKKDEKVEDIKDDKKDEKSDVKKDDKKPEDKTDEKTDTDESVKEVLKNTVDYLIKSGQWVDFKDREELDITPEVYGKIVLEQNNLRVKEMFDELVDETGEYGKAIISFVKSGGDPDKIIDIFKEQKEIESFDTKTPEGGKLLVNKYYKEVLGWKPEKIERHISGLVAKDELETEVSEVEELYQEHTKKELEKVNREREEYLRQQEEREAAFTKNISTAVNSRKDLNEKEKKLIQKSILDRQNKLPNGNVVSDFYIKFAEMQADPNEYVDFVQFVMFKQAYIDKIKNEISNKAVDKTFNFVKGNAALNKKAASEQKVQHQQGKEVETFNFGFTKK